MSVICEKVPLEILKKTAFEGIEEHILVRRTERPKDIPIAEKWCMEPCFMPKPFEKAAQSIIDFVVRPDDVWIVTYPKCGTTWTQEMTWLICNNLDYEDASKVTLIDRFPHLEVKYILSPEWDIEDTISEVENNPAPRFVKSHLPAHLLPSQLWTVKPKIVYVARNIKDAAVSFFHHHSNLHYYSGTFSDFMDIFVEDRVLFSPIHSHIVDFWKMRNEENIFFLTYEDMKKDLRAVIHRMMEFFGKTYTEEQIHQLEDHLSFAKFSKNTSVNMDHITEDLEKRVGIKKDPSYNFVRRGQSGGFRDEMSQEFIKRFDKWTTGEMQRLNCDPELRKIFFLDGN